MKVLVTGGAGFIGSHIVEPFQGRAEVRVLDNLRSGGILCAILGWCSATSRASSSSQLDVRSLLPMFWVGSPVNPLGCGVLFRHLQKPGEKFRIAEKELQRQFMMFTLCTMKTCPSAQPLGFFDLELRGPQLEAMSNPLSWLEVVIAGVGFRRLLVSAHYNLFPTSRAAAHPCPDNLFKAPTAP